MPLATAMLLALLFLVRVTLYKISFNLPFILILYPKDGLFFYLYTSIIHFLLFVAHFFKFNTHIDLDFSLTLSNLKTFIF